MVKPSDATESVVSAFEKARRSSLWPVTRIFMDSKTYRALARDYCSIGIGAAIFGAEIVIDDYYVEPVVRTGGYVR